ncbi:MAG TPA: fasciclin domain-containing protein [Candidatus Limnocylindrales bacterium]|nr:fasciclin domain-containing protein [Candidatus Limnocylindrales bacterium]
MNNNQEQTKNSSQTTAHSQPISGQVSPIANTTSKLSGLFSNKKLLGIFSAAVVVLVAAGVFTTLRIRQNSQRHRTPTTNAPQLTQSTGVASGSDSSLSPQGSPTPASAPKPSITSPAATPKPKAPVTSPTPAPSVAPTPKPVNTTNCLPDNPSPYATHYIGMTNSGYLQTNSYGETNKLYAALQFAGLLSAIDAKQVVVFAPNDYIFDNKLTATQLAWMNQSPENMRSVLGWQIVTSCITWDGVNPVKDKPLGQAVTLNTLNGPVTYIHGGPGKVENADIAIWDWFTSNGSVTFITDFIKPPQVP